MYNLHLAHGGKGLSEEEINKGVEHYTKKAIEVLKDRKFIRSNISYFSGLALRVIISSVFDLGVWQLYDSTIYIPTSQRDTKSVDTSSTNVCLPNDIINREIFNRVLSPRSSLKMEMTSKSVKRMKYEYEHLITLVPRQALLILSKLYVKEKDPQYKEYLFSLAIKAYSAMGPKRRVGYKDVSNSLDIMVTLLAMSLQCDDSSVGEPASEFYSGNIDLLNMLIDEGIIDIKTLRLRETFFSGATSLPDGFITFIERWEEAASRTNSVRLYDDLINGEITYSYNWRLMLDVIKKGYVKEPSSIKERAINVTFLDEIGKCSQEDKLLLLGYFKPNPITDFFLGGIKPNVEEVVRYCKNSNRRRFLVGYISFGLRFRDENVDYSKLMLVTDANGDHVDFRLSTKDNKILFLKEVEKGVHLVFCIDAVDEYGLYVIRSLGEFFILDNSFPTNKLFIECIANASDDLLKRIIEYAQDNEQILGYIYEYTDPSITDLELYKRFIQNINTIVEEAD